MKFSCNVADFREAYSLASHTLDKVKNATSTKMLLVQTRKAKEKERVFVFSSNGVAYTFVKVPGSVESVGSQLVEPKELGKTLPTLDEDAKLAFELKNAKLQMSCGNFKPRCAIADPAPLEVLLKNLPLTVEPDLEIPAWKLREVMERTMTFTLKTEGAIAQPFLQNVFLRTHNGGLEAYASNNAVLAKGRVELEGDVPEIKLDIPAGAVPALQKILSDSRFKAGAAEKVPTIKLIIEKDENGAPKRFFVRTDDVMYGTHLSSARIPGKAVEVEQGMLKASTALVQVKREAFQATVRRCEPFLAVYGQAKAFKMELKDNALILFDRDGEVLDKLEGCGESNGVAESTVDLMYMSGVLNASKEEVITCRFINGTMLVSSGADAEGRSFYVVAAMRGPAKQVDQAAGKAA